MLGNSLGGIGLIDWSVLNMISSGTKRVIVGEKIGLERRVYTCRGRGGRDDNQRNANDYGERDYYLVRGGELKT